MFERTGGSTSTNKLIPYTQSLRLEFDAMSKPWMANALNNYYKSKRFVTVIYNGFPSATAELSPLMNSEEKTGYL